MKKIGIFAGTFDPVHLGHSAFVHRAIDQHGLDRVLILVEKKPRFKDCFASYEHRKNMVELAFANYSQIVVYETASDDFPITSSLPRVRSEYPGAQLYLLVGEDVAEHIDTWDNSDELLKGVKLIVGKRDDQAPYGHASSFKVRTSLKDRKVSYNLDPRVQDYIADNNLY